MVFRVLLQVNAAKELKKLDETNKVRIKKALAELESDPWKAGKPLNPSDYWSVRAGDYRAIYRIYARPKSSNSYFDWTQKKRV